MSETPTPRTDAAITIGVFSEDYCRGMEQSLDTALAALTAARAEMAQVTKERDVAQAFQREAESDAMNHMRTITQMIKDCGEHCAELAALRAEQEKPQWLPIESAPRDGTAIQLGNEYGSWLGYWEPVYPSGYRPDNPWTSLMLNHRHMKRPVAVPTHWMPLLAPPRDLREGGE